MVRIRFVVTRLKRLGMMKMVRREMTSVARRVSHLMRSRGSSTAPTGGASISSPILLVGWWELGWREGLDGELEGFVELGLASW